jgi:APA family basic amino acid/polyamine antiporter
MKSRNFTPAMAGAVVVANMIGTGVFTSLGFQLLDIQSGFVLIMLWVVGGLTALCGALTYAELGSALPRSGGEYNFLSEIYHPGAGFVSGWISATIGFAAPSALAAITFGSYLSSVFPSLSSTWLASILVVVLTIIHASNRSASGGTQLIFTQLKLLLIVTFCLLAWFMVETPQPVRFLPRSGDGDLLISGAFAVSLIYVNYAYTGWNAATYLTGEIENPQKNIPAILILGTALVMLVYVALNYIFLYVAPIDAMVGKVEIGYVAARSVFGDTGGAIMGITLSLLLISTVSAMVLAGPRVLQVIGQDFPIFRLLAQNNKSGVPAIAISVQGLVTLIFILTSSFESILVFSGFTLGVNTLFTVAGIFILRWRKPDLPRPYRTWLYPLPPLIYLALTGWTLAYILSQRPKEAWNGIVIIVIGAAFYLGIVAFSRFARTRGKSIRPD